MPSGKHRLPISGPNSTGSTAFVYLNTARSRRHPPAPFCGWARAMKNTPSVTAASAASGTHHWGPSGSELPRKTRLASASTAFWQRRGNR